MLVKARDDYPETHMGTLLGVLFIIPILVRREMECIDV